jgi:hypothetical protein
LRFYAAGSDREKSDSYQGMPSGIPPLTQLSRLQPPAFEPQRKAQPRERS